LPTGAAATPGEINPVTLKPGESLSAALTFRDFGYVEGSMSCAAAKTALFNMQVGKSREQSAIPLSPPSGAYRVTLTIQFDSYPNAPNLPEDIRAAETPIENDPVPLWKGGKVVQSDPVEIVIR